VGNRKAALAEGGFNQIQTKTLWRLPDEILFVVPGGPEVVAISLWDSKENAETYNRATYPEVLKTLYSLEHRGRTIGKPQDAKGATLGFNTETSARIIHRQSRPETESSWVQTSETSMFTGRGWSKPHFPT
jgi:hypothetical protein